MEYLKINTQFYLFLFAFALSACEMDIDEPQPIDHLELGNPSNAITDINTPDNYLLRKAQYILSYNRDRAIANWVSWHLSNVWRGDVDRQDDFRGDDELPDIWFRAAGSDYRGSGFDRGHICPSADRTNTVANNSATFFMTNMIPQSPDSNRGPWADFENFIRSQIADGTQEAYVIAGAYGRGGTGSEGRRTTIDNGNITVPARIWKVVVILPNGNNDVDRVNASTQVIAIDMPNTQGIRNRNWADYITNVDTIEDATGLDLLSRVPISAQRVIEERVFILQ